MEWIKAAAGSYTFWAFRGSKHGGANYPVVKHIKDGYFASMNKQYPWYGPYKTLEEAQAVAVLMQ